MIQSSTSLSDIVRGIAATAPQAEDEALIELHEVLRQRIFPRLIRPGYRGGSGASERSHEEVAEVFTQVA